MEQSRDDARDNVPSICLLCLKPDAFLSSPLLFLPVHFCCFVGVCGVVFLDATIKCPDILNLDVGTIVIGTESFDGPNAALCERPAAA